MTNQPVIFRFLTFTILIGCFIFNTSLNAQESNTSPYFFVQSDDPTVDQLPLKSTAAKVNIAGVMADVQISQRYKNEGTRPLEAIYVFPASTRAAVYGMEMKIGDRTITAKIEEKGKARQAYETAKAEGKRSSLLEQERPNVFQMNVANIMPGEEIEVLLKYTELLVPEKGIYSFIYPTVVGPRYTGENSNSRDQQFAKQPYAKAGKTPSYDYDMQIYLAAGMPIQNVESTSHQVNIKQERLDAAMVRLDATERQGGNRDFILNYSLAGKQINSGLLLYEGEKENFFVLMAQPPKRIVVEEIPAREYIFIVDVSGSMGGFPLDITKKLMRNLLSNLRPSDRFNVLLFSGTSGWLSEESVFATPENTERAVNVIDNQRGGGGTRLLEALQKSLAFERCEEGLSRSMVLVSDGYISVEKQGFDLVRKSLGEANFFSFGIGRSVNRLLMEGLAHVGGSEAMIITDPSEAAAQAERFRTYIQTPLLSQVKVAFEGMEVYDIEPVSIPDVLAERPIVVYGKYKGKAKGKIRLSGFTGQGAYEQSLNVSAYQADSRHAALPYLWAREKIRLLGDYNVLGSDDKRKAAITQLGLNYNLLTDYTSFIAIDHEVARDPNQPIKTQKQALPIPAGVPNSAVGFGMSIEGLTAFKSDKIEAPEDPFAYNKSTSLESESVIPVSKEVATREAITFILGKDGGPKNRYYSAAEQYYREHANEATEQVVTHCRSLQEVKEYLETNKPVGQAWGLVNLVVHSNEWTGLDAAVVPNGKRVTAARLDAAMRDGTYVAPKAGVLDVNSEIRVYACAMGRNEALLSSLTRAFSAGGQKCGPTVRSARYFMSYGETEGQPQRMMAEYWYGFYRTGYQLGDIRMARQLERNNPKAGVDWREALSRTQPRFAGDLYHHKFRLPLTWTVTYPSKADRPKWANKSEKMAWLETQDGLMAQLKTYGMSKEAFTWTFQKIHHTTEDGKRQPAVKVIGLCTVVCVLRAITEEGAGCGATNALQPSIEDRKYFSVAKQE